MACSSGTGGSVGSTDHSGGSGAGGPVAGTRASAECNRGSAPEEGVRRPRDAGHTELYETTRFRYR
jgi:hypothetical protein